MTAIEAVGEPSAGHAEREPVTEPADEQPATGPAPRQRDRAARPAPLPLWAGVVLALACGAAMMLAFPPYGLWWLAPVSTALLAVAAHRRRLRAGAGLGALAGLAFFVPLLSWTEIV